MSNFHPTGKTRTERRYVRACDQRTAEALERPAHAHEVEETLEEGLVQSDPGGMYCGRRLVEWRRVPGSFRRVL